MIIAFQIKWLTSLHFRTTGFVKAWTWVNEISFESWTDGSTLLDNKNNDNKNKADVETVNFQELSWEFPDSKFLMALEISG